MSETVISSFMIRFVQAPPLIENSAEGGTSGWHGTIRHVQSNELLRFTRIEDALQFIAGYVDIVADAPPAPGDS